MTEDSSYSGDDLDGTLLGLMLQSTSIPDAKAAIYRLFEQVIGEDFSNWGELDTQDQYYESKKNDLRATQRQAARRVCGMENKEEES